MRSKVLGVLKYTIISLAVVTGAALLAMTIVGSEFRVQANEQISKLPDLAVEPHVVAYNPNNLIRFHVVANSDSDRDQALKRRVRDLVVQKMAPEFSKAKDLAEARRIAGLHLEEIKEIAIKEVKQWGFDYPVNAELGKFDFPVKTYGTLTLPAGNYEAVKVVIGNGQGANWWCVLFPPLCFVDVSKAMTPESEKVSEVVYKTQDLGSNVEISFSEQAEEPDNENVVIRFKILELFGW